MELAVQIISNDKILRSNTVQDLGTVQDTVQGLSQLSVFNKTS